MSSPGFSVGGRLSLGMIVTNDVPGYKGLKGRIVRFNEGEVGVELFGAKDWQGNPKVVWFHPVELQECRKSASQRASKARKGAGDG